MRRACEKREGRKGSDSRIVGSPLVLHLGVDVLLQGDTELLPQGLELGEVLLVLALVLDLGLDACGTALVKPSQNIIAVQSCFTRCKLLRQWVEA